jgi:FAS-associated factor 2
MWKLWRAARLHPEPAADDKTAVRVSVRMPDGERLIRRFDGELDVEEIYAFVDCWDILRDGAESKEASKPTDFKHEYSFRLVSPVPRVVYDIKDSGSLRERLGRSANLMVETVDADEENE